MKRTLTQSPRCAVVMALLISFSFPQTAVTQSFFDGLLETGKQMFDTAVSKGKEFGATAAEKAKEMTDLAIKKGEEMGKKNKEAQKRSQQDLQLKVKELQKEFDWVKPYKRQLEDEIVYHLDKLRDRAVDGYAIAVDGIEIAAEQVQALKSQLVDLAVAARAQQDESTKKVIEAAKVVKEKGQAHVDSAVATGVDYADEGLAKVKEGAAEASVWVYKFKDDLTSLATQAKQAFDKNNNGVLDVAEWNSFSKAFGLDGKIDADSDGKISDEELDKALEHNIDKITSQAGGSSDKKHDEM